MQNHMNLLEELIGTFVNDDLEGKSQLVEWFLSNVMDQLFPETKDLITRRETETDKRREQ